MAAALFATGCGSGDDTSSESAALTKAEFVKQANAICKKGNATFESEFEAFAKEHNLNENKAPSKAVQEEAIDQIAVPRISSQVEEIRALGTPKGDDGELEGILTGVEEGLEEAEENPAVLFGEAPSKFKQVNKETREYGLTVCGEEGE
jgi:hypothetical protein